jgi:Tol biopolymer transport system component
VVSDTGTLALACAAALALAACGGGGGGGTDPDVTPPSVTVTAPAPGPVSGEVALAADASDAGGVAGVTFMVDGTAVGSEDPTAPYGVSWSSAGVADGPHAITAVARDAAGNTSTSAAVAVMVSNPAGTGSLNVVVTLTGDGTPAADLTVVVDGVARGTLPGAGTLTVGAVPAGSHAVSLGVPSGFCHGVGQLSQSVVIATGETTVVDFTVDCAAPPAGRLLYQGRLFSGASQFVTVDPDGSDPSTRDMEGGEPDWSRDRSRIVYVKAGDLHVMNADGSGDVTLFVTPDPELQPRWSPDGERVAYYAPRGGPTSLDAFFTEVDQPSAQPFFAAADKRVGPSWSPDGARIAYSVSDGDGSSIWVADADGTDPVEITSGAIDVSPAWSPDGSRIAFRRMAVCCQQTEIWVVGADGSNPVNLTNDPAYDYDPEWSPDGEWIAFVSERGGAQRVWIMRADGSSPVALSPTTYQFVSRPSWR